MGDHADDLALAEYFGTSTPVRDMDGRWYVYTHKGVKYQFRTIEKANEWAKSKGFRLSTEQPKTTKKREKGVTK